MSKRRKSIGVAKAAAESPRPTNAPDPLSESEISALFEQCIKITTENKINVNNSWNLPLIDYFHDMTLLKEGDSINFSKASCTLDGCVKIYTSRVDSVENESKRLLNGLSDQNGKDDEGEGNGDDIEGAAKYKRKARSSGKTLEDDINNLNIKIFDLEYNVDPLFKKTSADFDEGGAKGLLLNHLNIGSDGRIIFDSTDITTADSLVDQKKREEEVKKEEFVCDISRLKDNFMSKLSNIWSKDVCPSFKKFEFSSSSKSSVNDFFNPQDILDSASQDLFSGDFTNFDNNVGNFSDDDDNGGGFDNVFEGEDFNGRVSLSNNNNAIPIILGELGNNRRASVATVLNEDGDGDGKIDDLFSYFDKGVSKTAWIGPEHWRSRPIRKNNDELTDFDPTATVKKRKPRAPPIKIDFTQPPPDLKALFAIGKATINMPKSLLVNANKNLLPSKDYNISSDTMISLFTRPSWKVVFRKNDGTVRNSVEDPENVENQEADFWAQHNNDHPVFENDNQPIDPNGNQPGGYDDYYSDDDDDGDLPPLPADFPASQEFSVASEKISQGDYGSQLVDEPKKVKAQFLTYARVAKKVDVKRLKDNIWNRVQDLANNEEEEKVDEDCKFTEIVSGLNRCYNEKKLKDISVAFCFICLLHLANEEGLEIEGKDTVSNGKLSDAGMNELIVHFPTGK